MRWLELENGLVHRGLDRAHARDLIWAALQSRSLRVITAAPMVERQELGGSISDELVLSSIRKTLLCGPVATLPVSQPDTDIPPTLRVFRQIIGAVSKELIIASPYLDDIGVEKVAEALSAAAARGAQIRVLTRETEARQPGRLRGLARISQLAGRKLLIRDYHTKAIGFAHYTSLHAKLLIADSSVAYVGSAEIRGNALEKNFEIGAVLWDKEAAEARAAFEAVWSVARSVIMSGAKNEPIKYSK